MKQGTIDSASIYEIVTIFRYDNLKNSYPWAFCSGVDLTTLLITAPYLSIAPSPGLSGAASGPYGTVIKGLQTMVTPNVLDIAKKVQAITDTRKHIDDHPILIPNCIDTLNSDKTNFSHWIDSSITYAWKEHSIRLNGLFDPDFLPQISNCTHIPENDLNELLINSRNLKLLDSFIRHRPDNDEFKGILQAYISSVLIRGIYHDLYAKSAMQDIVHHRVRNKVFSSLPTNPEKRIVVYNSISIFASAIIEGSFVESSQAGRIALWIENVKKARIAYQEGIIDLRPKDTIDIATAVVRQAIKTAELRLHPKCVEYAIEIAGSIGAGILTSFYLQEWPSFFATTGIAWAIYKMNSFGGKVSRGIYNRKYKLDHLIKLSTGRLLANWEHM